MLIAESEANRAAYFDTYRDVLQTAYVASETPWGGSGKDGTYFDWLRARLPIAEAVDRSGSFLDIGCANGFLLECLMDWHHNTGIEIEPHGLDYAPGTLGLAKARLPAFADHLHLGNAWNWQPPQRYDFVRSETVYVPVNDREAYARRLLAEFVAPGGALLLCQYASSRGDKGQLWFNAQIESWGLNIERIYSGYAANGREVCRVAVVRADSI
jgi:SAM-dependent methyltransferase